MILHRNCQTGWIDRGKWVPQGEMCFARNRSGINSG